MPGSIARSVGAFDEVWAQGVPRWHEEIIDIADFQAGAGTVDLTALTGWASMDFHIMDAYCILTESFVGGGATRATVDVGTGAIQDAILKTANMMHAVPSYQGTPNGNKGIWLTDGRTPYVRRLDTLKAVLDADGGGVMGLTAGIVHIWFLIVEME